jgi:hypothetical protein
MKILGYTGLILMILFHPDVFSQKSSVYAVVDGNNVTIWEIGAGRNCGAIYEMQVEMEGNSIDWYQVDTGMAAYCTCNFDLSVTFGPLQPGDYTVNVYYTESFSEDTLMSGTTSFTITTRHTPRFSGIIGHYQGDCYFVGTEDSPDLQSWGLEIYPNPLQAGDILFINTRNELEDAELVITTLDGRSLFKKKFPGNQYLRENLEVTDIFPHSGMYILMVESRNIKYFRKIIVM